MGINTFLIAQLCSSLSGAWCSPTSEAMFKYTGVYQQVNSVEGYATNRAKEYVGKDVQSLITVPLAIVSLVEGKEAKLRFKSHIIADSVELRGKQNKGSVGLVWGF